MIIGSLIFYAVLTVPFAWAQGPKTVAILPFKVNAAEDLTYLREGIGDMLASRLALQEEVAIVNQGLVRQKIAELGIPDDASKALAIGRALECDYVILGSLTVFGESVSLDAKILDVTASQELTTAFRQSKGMSEVIPAVNQLALDLKERIVGRPVPPQLTAKPAEERIPAGPVRAPAPVQPAQETAQAKPAEDRKVGTLLTDQVKPSEDRTILGSVKSALGISTEKREPAGPAEGKTAFGVLLTAEETLDKGKQGPVQEFKVNIRSLDVGDVDGDGKKEVVFVDEKTVYIYKRIQRSLRLFKQVKGKWATNYVWVSLGDMNRNGRDEIYVSNPEGLGISSFVLEWDGQAFKKIAGRQPWFFRVVEIPGRGKTLLGQKRDARLHFQGAIHLLQPENGGYVSTGTLNLDASATVLNVALFRPEETSGLHSVVLNKNDYLTLYNPNNKRLWTSKDHFGGAYSFIAMDSGDYTPGSEARYYLPAPLYTTDLDEDGRPEIMVCRNTATLTSRFAGRYRSYSGGEVTFLVWNQAGLSMKWKTGDISGCVTGYRVVDFDGDGRKQLVIASVLSAGESVLSAAQSRMIVYDLN